MKQSFFSRHSEELRTTVSGRLLDITMKNLNQVFGGASFAGVNFGSLAEDVITNFAVDNFDQ